MAFQDKGAFNTTLSDEWMHLQRSNKLSLEELFKLNLEAVNHIFLDNPSKQDIRNAIVSWFDTYRNKQQGDELPTSVIDSKTCKFAVIPKCNDTKNVNNAKCKNDVKQLCNKVRGQKCDMHNK